MKKKSKKRRNKLLGKALNLNKKWFRQSAQNNLALRLTADKTQKPFILLCPERRPPASC
tara:strand:+ start:334 stop:510 length:177 start_codon:yes stop_codon:yes gene_type:complete